MKQTPQHIRPCSQYAGLARHLAELSEQHPERVAWEAHAVTCDACRSFLASEVILATALRNLPDPRPILVKGAVMAQIKGRRRMPLLRLRDIYWGVSAGFVGIIFGLMLVRAESQTFAGRENASGGEQVGSIAVIDDFDTYVADMTANGGTN